VKEPNVAKAGIFVEAYRFTSATTAKALPEAHIMPYRTAVV
jgi:hypothetical protein